jgi:SAM-dependent methyltransferase
MLIHVGMNLADKPAAFCEVRRVLRQGGLFGLYEVMRTGPADLTFPLPWASGPDQSALATPDDYRAGLAAAGFDIVHERGRRAMALDYFARIRARMEAEGPPALGLHVLVGPGFPERIAKMVAALQAGTVEPVEMIARAP